MFQARSSLATGRAARDTPCAEIREQLATRRGAALRRTVLRRHLRECPGCRAFRDTVQVQRRKLNLLLPLAPAAGLKRALLGAIYGSGSGLPGGAAVTTGALSGTGLVAVALAPVAIPAAAIAGALSESRDTRQPAPPGARAPTTAQPAAPATESTWHAAAGIQGATQVPERRAPARANRNDNDAGAPNQAAVPERASNRAEADAVDTPQPAKTTEHPNANREGKPVTPSRAHRRMTPLKPPKANGRAKPAKPPNANAELRRAAPPQRIREPHAPDPPQPKGRPRAREPPQSKGEPREPEPPQPNRESSPAEPPNANGRGHAG